MLPYQAQLQLETAFQRLPVHHQLLALHLLSGFYGDPTGLLLLDKATLKACSHDPQHVAPVAEALSWTLNGDILLVPGIPRHHRFLNSRLAIAAIRNAIARVLGQGIPILDSPLFSLYEANLASIPHLKPLLAQAFNMKARNNPVARVTRQVLRKAASATAAPAIDTSPDALFRVAGIAALLDALKARRLPLHGTLAEDIATRQDTLIRLARALGAQQRGDTAHNQLTHTFAELADVLKNRDYPLHTPELVAFADRLARYPDFFDPQHQGVQRYYQLRRLLQYENAEDAEATYGTEDEE